jgi:hypothetical protein
MDRNRSDVVSAPVCAKSCEILRAEICHRDADRGGAVNQRAGDQNLLGQFFGLGRLSLRDLLGLRRQDTR